jgi:glyoxylase I family protein
MPTAIKFYCEVLGFQIASTDGKPDFDWVMLRLNGVELMLNTAYERSRRPAKADPARMAAHNDTTLYFACPDVDAAYTHLRSKGANVKPPTVAWYGMKQLYITDPDGYLLCFQWGAKQPVPAG